VDFLVQTFEKDLHELMPLGGQSFAFRGEHLVFDLAEFHQEFPVGRVFGGVGSGFCHIHPPVMQPGSDLAGKEKGPADADGADGVQLVRVKKDLGFQGFRNFLIAVAVRFDAVDDCVLHFLGKFQPLENGAGHLRPLGGMADLASGEHFVAAADVVKQGRGAQDVQAGVHQAADVERQVVDPFGVVRPVAAAFGLAVLMGNGQQPFGELLPQGRFALQLSGRRAGMLTLSVGRGHGSTT